MNRLDITASKQKKVDVPKQAFLIKTLKLRKNDFKNSMYEIITCSEIINCRKN